MGPLAASTGVEVAGTILCRSSFGIFGIVGQWGDVFGIREVWDGSDKGSCVVCLPSKDSYCYLYGTFGSKLTLERWAFSLG